MNKEPSSQARKKRGYRANAPKVTATVALEQQRESKFSDGHLNGLQEAAHPAEELPEAAAEGKESSLISSFLRSVLAHDRTSIIRLARTLDVTEHTVYRWMNGTSMPQQTYLKHLPNALPEHRNKLTYIIKQMFPGLLELDVMNNREIQKDTYQHIVNIVAANDEEDLRLWYAIQALFDNMLLQFDPDLHGLAVTYAKLSPAREDGQIYSLREFEMRGHTPWSSQTATARAFLGGTSLAGRAAMYQRWQAWNGELEGRIPVQIDKFERSACAAPLIRGRNIAGVLIVSSVYPMFFNDTKKCEMIDEYAKLLSIAVPPSSFQSIYHLNLHLMPELEVQRTRLDAVYIDLILKYVTLYNLQRSEAEQRAEQDMEKEFEKQVSQEEI